jgi:hypothetical protein
MSQRKRVEPGPGQESVWDYPRPPRLEDSNKHIQEGAFSSAWS